MSDQKISSESKAKRFLGSFAILAVFGFLALIFVQGVQTESLEERAYKGEFDAATIEQRWANYEEVSSAQASLLDEKKLAAAKAKVVKSVATGAKSEVVVPGSPTFLKQMEAASTQAEDESKPDPKPKNKSDSTEKAQPKPNPKSEAAKPKASEVPKKPETKAEADSAEKK